jgi:hypothetical protein
MKMYEKMIRVIYELICDKKPTLGLIVVLNVKFAIKILS